jgi:uncharacterized protein YjeT (DUF2065 family)
MGLLLSILGALLVLEGLPYLAFPRKTKEWALLLQEIPEGSLRWMGLVSIVVGLALLFFIRYI